MTAHHVMNSPHQLLIDGLVLSLANGFLLVAGFLENGIKTRFVQGDECYSGLGVGLFKTLVSIEHTRHHDSFKTP